MPTYIIRIISAQVPNDKFILLEKAMKQQNFVPNAITASKDKEFSYFGNLNLFDINSAVKKAVQLSGAACGFTIMRDKLSEKQYHRMLL